MFDNTPRIFYVALFAFIGIFFLAIIGYTKNEQVIYACKIAAWFFLIVSAVLMGLVVWDERIRAVQVMTDWMHEFARMDEDARAAVAFTFPSTRYHMKKGVVREYFEDTNVPVEMFRMFLSMSNGKSISAERDWNSREKPRWAWLEIKAYLEGQGYVLEDSYAGNHSWLWRGNAYQHLKAYWTPLSRLDDMNTGTEAVYQE